jgi:FixJ family two-component response regulator
MISNDDAKLQDHCNSLMRKARLPRKPWKSTNVTFGPICFNRRILFNSELVRISGVEGRVLNQAVKRNAERFPGTFFTATKTT